MHRPIHIHVYTCTCKWIGADTHEHWRFNSSNDAQIYTVYLESINAGVRMANAFMVNAAMASFVGVVNDLKVQA